MSTPIKDRYIPKTLNQLLGCVVEECGELMAAVGKTQRWGLLSYNPEIPEWQREPNMHWILREVRDLEDRMDKLKQALGDAHGLENYDLDQPLRPRLFP